MREGLALTSTGHWLTPRPTAPPDQRHPSSVQSRLALGSALSHLEMDAPVPTWHSKAPVAGTHWQALQVPEHPSGASTARPGPPRRPLAIACQGGKDAAAAAGGRGGGRSGSAAATAAATAFTKLRSQARAA